MLFDSIAILTGIILITFGVVSILFLTILITSDLNQIKAQTNDYTIGAPISTLLALLSLIFVLILIL